MRCSFYYRKLQKVKKLWQIFLAEHSDPRTTKLYEDLPDKITEVCMTQTSFKEQVWQLFFDGASRMGPRENIVAKVEVVLISPQNDSSHILIS